MSHRPASGADEVLAFLGPSLARAEAETLLDARYLPPVAQGDVIGCLHRRPRLLVIIDGHFHRTPAVWHKELLAALAAGVRVLGAASMGALRAAELAAFGMEGVGRIFDWYATGALVADDEVALVHGAEADGWLPLSLPLVNLRATLAAAAEAGIGDEAGRARVLAAARARYYAERTWSTLAADCGPAQRALLEWCRAHTVDQKAADARAVLRYAAETRGRAAAPATFALARTVFLAELGAVDAVLGAHGVTPGLLAEYQRLRPRAAELLARAQLAQVVDLAAARLGLRIDEERLAAVTEEFWRRHGVRTPWGVRLFLERNRMDASELRRLLGRGLLLEQLQALAGGQGTGFLAAYLADELRLEDGLAPEAERVAAHERTWPQRQAAVDLAALPDALWAEILARARRAAGDEAERLDLAGLARELGFDSPVTLVIQALKERPSTAPTAALEDRGERGPTVSETPAPPRRPRRRRSPPTGRRPAGRAGRRR